MIINENIVDRMARYASEMVAAQAQAELARMAKLQSELALRTATEKLRTLYRDQGLDLALHEVAHDEAVQSNGAVIPKGLVFLRKERTVYEPPAPPPPEEPTP